MKSQTLLAENGCTPKVKSRWYSSLAHPPGSGPDFINGAALAEFDGSAEEALALLHATEATLGRTRNHRWEARICDLDLVAAGDRVTPDLATVERMMALGDRAAEEPAPDILILPHPRMHERAFVLGPLMDVAPDWRHPLLDRTVAEMWAALPEAARQGVSPLD